MPAEGLLDLLTRIFICILLPSEHLLGYIAYSFDRFCSSIHAKVRKVVIGAIWIRGRLTCFVDSDKGKDVLEGYNPYAVWIVNKKWPLSEKLAQHILRSQQVHGPF